jgi:hypothetical protein
MQADRKINVSSGKHSLTLFRLLALTDGLTDRMTDGGTNTLAGSVLEEIVFSVVPLCQVFSCGRK